MAMVLMLCSQQQCHGFVSVTNTNSKSSALTSSSSSALNMVTPPANMMDKKKRQQPVAFKQLFRHYDDISMDCFLRTAEPLEFFLSCGYTQEEIDAMAQEWPALLTKDVHDHLAPHVRFLVKALEGGTGDLMWATVTSEDTTPAAAKEEDDEECWMETKEEHMLQVSDVAKQVIPVRYFNVRLEKTMAPWHAYLSWQEGLPSGKALLENDGEKFQQFLQICESSKLDPFVDLCNAWETGKTTHTVEGIFAFVRAFHEGLVPAVRNHLHTSTTCEPGRMVELLLTHGANHLEDDHHGASLLHWAAGTGNMKAVRALLKAGKEDGIPVEEIVLSDHVAKDGATPLHWAATGVSPYGVFGTGGHVDICRLFLDLAGHDLTDETTYSQNSPLEWAAWAGSLDVVKLLIEEYKADPHFCGKSGNAAHWACAGGSLPVCQYLADTCGVDFSLPNESKGWTPLDLTKEEGHAEVAEWLAQRLSQDNQQSHTEEDEELLKNEVAEAMVQESKQKHLQDGSKKQNQS